MEALSCKNLSFSYNGCNKKALSDISFSVDSGDIMLIMGKSGCGKTTLLKMLKKQLEPAGVKTGHVTVMGKDEKELTLRHWTEKVGFVMQNPDTQTVTDKVSSELCFGLENLGIESSEINRRVGEMASFFGIEKLYNREIYTLSGGQKQLCNLCSVMAMSPDILLLDEPTAQLDPISSQEFLHTLRRLNEELGTTIIIVEHNPEEIFSICDKVLVMDMGRQKALGTPQEICRLAADGDDELLMSMPSAVQIYSVCPVKTQKSIPLSVKEGKSFIEKLEFSNNTALSTESLHTGFSKDKIVLSARNLWQSYDKNQGDILRGVDLDIYKGEIISVLGSNGTGKTTLINALSGIIPCWQGKIKILGKNLKRYKGNSLYSCNAAVLPQNPYDLFLCSAVREDFIKTIKDTGCDDKTEELCRKFSVEYCLDMHPYDLSGGEIQKCGLIKVLLTNPQIIFLDEPSKAMDRQSKKELGEIVQALSAEGRTICIVTHDIEFAAEYSHRCGLFFDGKIISQAAPEDFFSTNNFYTTAARRISRNVLKNAVTTEQVKKLVREGRVK